MYYRYLYFAGARFTEHTKEALIEYLNIKQIPYERTSFLKFELLSTDLCIDEKMETLKNRFNVKPRVTYLEFSSKEINQAPLLWVNPKRQIIEFTANKDSFQYFCKYKNILGNTIAQHVQQPGTLMIRKEPTQKTSTSIYASVWWGFVQIFADKRVYDLVQEHDLKGFEFQKVLRKNGEYSDTFFQLRTLNIIGRERIPPQKNEKIIHCPVCGKAQYKIDTDYWPHVDYSKIDLSYDLYETEDIFCDTDRTIPLHIISQRFYQLLKKNKLAGSLAVVPVADSSQQD